MENVRVVKGCRISISFDLSFETLSHFLPELTLDEIREKWDNDQLQDELELAGVTSADLIEVCSDFVEYEIGNGYLA